MGSEADEMFWSTKNIKSSDGKLNSLHLPLHFILTDKAACHQTLTFSFCS